MSGWPVLTSTPPAAIWLPGPRTRLASEAGLCTRRIAHGVREPTAGASPLFHVGYLMRVAACMVRYTVVAKSTRHMRSLHPIFGKAYSACKSAGSGGEEGRPRAFQDAGLSRRGPPRKGPRQLARQILPWARSARIWRRHMISAPREPLVEIGRSNVRHDTRKSSDRPQYAQELSSRKRTAPAMMS
jgi:hypothetical protein